MPHTLRSSPQVPTHDHGTSKPDGTSGRKAIPSFPLPFFLLSRSRETRERDEEKLLKHLPVRPLVLLSVDGNRLVPGPHVVDEGAVLGLGVVEPGELVRLVVRGDVESGQGLVAAYQEGALDDAVVGDAVDGAAAKQILARGLEAGEKAACLRVLVGSGAFGFEARGFKGEGGRKDEAVGGGRGEEDIPIRFDVMKVMVSSSLYL